MAGVYRPLGLGDGPKAVYELMGGPLDGQRWKLPRPASEFALSVSPGALALYRSSGPDWPPRRMHFAGLVYDEGD